MPDLAVWPTDGADGSVSSELRWRKMGRMWTASGVDTSPLGIGGPGGGLTPTLAAGPTINVTIGGCWLDGHYAELTAPASIPASANGLLVVRFTPADNHAELLYRDAATAPTQTAATWELPIAWMSAGVLRDVRWMANPGAELANVTSLATVNLTAAHTVTAPADVVVLPAFYSDGTPLDITVSTLAAAITAGAGFVRGDLWFDATNLGSVWSAPSQAAIGGGISVAGRARYAPSIGFHQVRLRAWLSGATAAALTGAHLLVLRRV